MVLVNKKCSNCDKIDDWCYVPKDMIGLGFSCPFCKEGKVEYNDISQESEKA